MPQVRIIRRLSAGLDRLSEELGLRFALSSPTLAAASGDEEAALSEALHSVGGSHYIAAFLSRTYSLSVTAARSKKLINSTQQQVSTTATAGAESAGAGPAPKRSGQVGDPMGMSGSGSGISSKAAENTEAAGEGKRRPQAAGSGTTAVVPAAVTAATSAVAVRRSALAACCVGDSAASDLRLLAAAGTMRRIEEGKALIRWVIRYAFSLLNYSEYARSLTEVINVYKLCGVNTLSIIKHKFLLPTWKPLICP